VKKNQGFPSTERLKSRKAIERMFKEGQSFGQYPLRLVWLPLPEKTEAPVQFSVSVGKKKFPHAVDRNRLRRRVREAYRLHKDVLFKALDGQARAFGLMAIYTAADEQMYAAIEEAMSRALRRLAKIWRNPDHEPTKG
jgi:ribonuclease P protein component